MKDNDSRLLECIYENLAGQNFPQYGSTSPISIAPMGAESLRSGYVEIPNGKEDTIDLQILFKDLKKTIKKIYKKTNKENLKEGFASSFVKSAQKPSMALDTIGQTFKGMFSKSENKYVGYENNQIKPKKGNIVAYPQTDIFAEIIQVDPKNKQFTVRMIGIDIENDKLKLDTAAKYGFQRVTKTATGGWAIVEVGKGKTQPTNIVGKETSFPNWIFVDENKIINILQQNKTDTNQQTPATQQQNNP